MNNLPSVELTATLPKTGLQTWKSPTSLLIGRLPDLSVYLEHDSVSRRHAEVLLTSEGWVIRDLGSSNGTYLNGVRLGRTQHRIRTGDQIKVGELILQVQQAIGQSPKYQSDTRKITNSSLIRRGSDETLSALIQTKCQTTPWELLLPLIQTANQLVAGESGRREMKLFLDDVVACFAAQRGAILLVSAKGPLEVTCVSVSSHATDPSSRVTSIAATKVLAGKDSALVGGTLSVPQVIPMNASGRTPPAFIIGALIRSPERVFGVLQLERNPILDPFTPADLVRADALARAIAVGLERSYLVEQHQELLLQTITGLAQAVEMRDLYTGGHTSRVTTYSLMLADELGLPENEKQILRGAGPLHDIGKIAIDDSILRKPGRLTESEFAQMKTHVTRGAEIIETMPGLAWALPVVRSHHERWDGTGYPDGLRGEGIPRIARILALADAFDAMTSDRPYRCGLPAEEAFLEIRDGSGTQFDPECVEAFLRIRSDIEALLNQERNLINQVESASKTISANELRRQIKELIPAANPTLPRPAKGSRWSLCQPEAASSSRP